jgi:hypothetical protein
MVKTSLKVLTRPDFKVPKPPRSLGEAGASLWVRITEEYECTDAGGIAMLTLICQSFDRCESLRTQIDEEGEIVKVKGSLRDHPSLRHELANRAFIAKALAKMGLNLETPVRAVGRPPGPGLGVGPEYRVNLEDADADAS